MRTLSFLTSVVVVLWGVGLLAVAFGSPWLERLEAKALHALSLFFGHLHAEAEDEQRLLQASTVSLPNVVPLVAPSEAPLAPATTEERVA